MTEIKHRSTALMRWDVEEVDPIVTNKEVNDRQRDAIGSLCDTENATLLIYSKNLLSISLSRAMKAEFGKVMTATEINDALTLLPNRLCESEPNIDIVVADADAASVKLLEAINVRATTPSTSMLPVVATVIIVPVLPEDEKRALLDSFAAVGGSNAIVYTPYSAYNIMEAMITAMRRCQIVESSYCGLIETNKMKYPFIPVPQSASVKEKLLDSADGSVGIPLSTTEEEMSGLLSSATRSASLSFENELDGCLPGRSRSPVARSPSPTNSSTSKPKSALRASPKNVPGGHRASTSRQSASSGQQGSSLQASWGFAASSTSPDSQLHASHRLPEWWKDDDMSSCKTSKSKAKRYPAAVSLPQLPNLDATPPKTVVGMDKRLSHMYLNSITPTKVRRNLTRRGSNLSPGTTTLGTPTGPTSVIKLTPSSTRKKSKVVFNEETPNGSRRTSDLTAKSYESTGSGGCSRGLFLLGGHSPTVPAFSGKGLLSTLAKNTQIESQLCTLMEINIANVQASIRELEFLRRGLNLDRTEEHDEACLFYQRALKHTKQPHIAQVFLGNSLYYQSRYFEALKEFTEAITHCQTHAVTPLLIPPLDVDVFTAVYNRSLTYFRLGDDLNGLNDMKEAMKIQPNNYHLAEILSRVLRRLGKFDEATSLLVDVSNMKFKEIQEKEFLAAQKLHHQRLMSGNESPERGYTPLGSVSASPAPPEFGDVSGLASLRSASSEKPSEKPRGLSMMKKALLRQSSVLSLASLAPEPPARVPEKAVYVDNMCLSMNDRKEYMLKHGRAMTALGGDEDATTFATDSDMFSLESFRHSHGLKSSLFESIFQKPATVQEALAYAPGSRTSDHCLVISNCILGLIPFLKGLSEVCLMDISQFVEYRIITSNTTVFHQNEMPDGMGFLVRGPFQQKLNTNLVSNGDLHSIVTSTLKDNDVFSHLDMLFQPLPLELPAPISPKRTSASNSITSEHDIANDEQFMQELHSSENSASGTCSDLLVSYVVPQSQASTELLLLPTADFYRLGLSHVAMCDLRKRLEAIKSCKVFDNFTEGERLQLARVSSIDKFGLGATILDQGERPLCLSIILKGLCTVLKKPEKLDVLIRKLNSMKVNATDHDMKFSYHHRLRQCKQMSHGSVPFERGTGLHTTQSEESRYKLEVEIARLEALIKRIEAEDSILPSASAEYNPILSTASEDLSIEGRNNVKPHHHKSAYHVNGEETVCTLQWPQLFGESSVLHPSNVMDDKASQGDPCEENLGGEFRSAGRVVAETPCEVLSIHNFHLQTFRIEEPFLERIRLFSVKY